MSVLNLLIIMSPLNVLFDFGLRMLDRSSIERGIVLLLQLLMLSSIAFISLQPHIRVLIRRKIVWTIFFFGLYLSGLSFTSTDLLLTLSYVSKLLVIVLFYFVGYFTLTSTSHIYRYCVSLLWGASLVFFLIVLANLFNFGEAMYATGPQISVGFFDGPNLYSSALVLGLMPFILSLNPREKRSIIVVLFVVLGVVFFLLLMRRTTILIIVITLALCWMRYGRTISGYFILFAVGLIILVFIVIFNSEVMSYIQLRHSKVYQLEAFLRENRFSEYFFVWDTLQQLDYGLLIGSGELFNSVGKYGWIDIHRFLHSDYSRLLFGSGLLGLVLYIYLHYLIYSQGGLLITANKKQKDMQIFANYLIILTIVIGFSGSMMFISFKVPCMLLVGGIHRCISASGFAEQNLYNS